MAGVTLDTSRVDKMLANLATSLSPASMAGYLGAVVFPHLSQRARERFAAEGDDAVGGEWQPLEQATLEIRDSLGFPPGPINVRTGHLRDSLVNGKPAVSHLGVGAMLTFPEKWDRPDLFWRNMQAAGAVNTHVQRPVVGITAENDVAHMLATLAAWIIGGKGLNG